MIHLIHKIKIKIWSKIVYILRDTKIYFIIYRSFWHFLFYKKVNNVHDTIYFSAVPNRGAGIGHQMANWIAGYWFAKQFNLKFAHIPFSSNEWESFLGFGNGEIAVQKLLKEGYKKVLLPLFNETNSKEVTLINRIISSYVDEKIVFLCEQNQSYHNQFGVQSSIQQKFFKSKVREKEKLVFLKDKYNIAIHVRRGDIVIGQKNNNPNLVMRWQNNEYFVNVLNNVLKHIETNKSIAIYLFSQGVEADFPEFANFENLTFCFDMSPQDSFSHMVFSDLLITSKSSFSYKPALLGNGLKVVPANFWHGYPKTKDWILADEDGLFNYELLKTEMK